MSRTKRLDRAFKSAHKIKINNNSKVVFFSDIHRGNGSSYDEFAKNSQLYITALNYYYRKGFTYVEVGDSDELWLHKNIGDIVESHEEVFEMLSRFHGQEKLYMIVGNHDKSKLSPSFNRGLPKSLSSLTMHEGIRLILEEDKEIFVVHGHQDDFFNDYISSITAFIFRYIAKPLQMLFCTKNPLSPAFNSRLKNTVEDRLALWVKKNNCPIITGHTHRPCFPVENSIPYINCGSCVRNNQITCVEINNNTISLIKWSIKTHENGSLYASRRNLTGEKKINSLFDF